MIGRAIHSLRFEKYRLLTRLRLYRQRRNPHPPILVYQMGKVGSRTVYRTLESLGLPSPIYHVHVLSPDGIRATWARYHKIGAEMPIHLIAGKEVRRRLDRHPEGEWQVVTLVRDPVARQISELFETLWLFHPELLTTTGVIDIEGALTELGVVFSWF